MRRWTRRSLLLRPGEHSNVDCLRHRHPVLLFQTKPAPFADRDLFATPLLVSRNVECELQKGLCSGHTELQPALDAIQAGTFEVLAMTEPARALVSRIGTPPDKGETDSLAYCLAHDAVFITNDRRAYRRGRELGIQCFRLSSLLRLLWTRGPLTPAEVRSLISEMESRLDFAVGQEEEIFADAPD